MEETEGLRRALSLASEPAERELLLLEIAAKEVQLEKAVYEKNYGIDELVREIAQMEEEASRGKIIAPADGVLTDVTFKRTGDRIDPREVLITLERTDGMLLRVDNANDYFRYGMEVTVEVGPAKSRVQLTCLLYTSRCV